MDSMLEPLYCPHGVEICALPNGEPYFPTPCAHCAHEVEAVAPTQRSAPSLVAA